MQNVIQIATNAGHTTQNDGRTAQNDGRTAQNDGRNTLNVCQGPKGGLEEPPRGPPLPLYMKKILYLKLGKIFKQFEKMGGTSSPPFSPWQT